MIDIREEIDNAQIGAYHRLLLFQVGLAVFFDGYDTFNASYVIHYVMNPWGMAGGRNGLRISPAAARRWRIRPGRSTP